MMLPCIICQAVLEPVMKDVGDNQPYKGTVFITHGHYGSTVFDPMDGSYLEITVCDDCLDAAATTAVAIGKTPQREPLKMWKEDLD